MMGFPSGDKSQSMPSVSDMGDDSEDIGKGGKLLALQNMIGAIADISDEELRPYIENLKNQIHLGHEEAEGDDLGVEQAQDASDMSEDGMDSEGKPKLDVKIGVGSPKLGSDMSESDEEDEDSLPKGGFLAILSKKMSEKGK